MNDTQAGWVGGGGGYTLPYDSVAHCGASLTGDFIWSLTYTDLASAWTEGRAVWNKGATGVLEQTRDVEAALPFVIRHRPGPLGQPLR